MCFPKDHTDANNNLEKRSEWKWQLHIVFQQAASVFFSFFFFNTNLFNDVDGFVFPLVPKHTDRDKFWQQVNEVWTKCWFKILDGDLG